MATSELKPCPFCGGEADIVDIPSHRDHSMELIVTCVADGCLYECATPAFTTEAEAIAAWNRRAADERE